MKLMTMNTYQLGVNFLGELFVCVLTAETSKTQGLATVMHNLRKHDPQDPLFGFAERLDKQDRQSTFEVTK